MALLSTGTVLTSCTCHQCYVASYRRYIVTLSYASRADHPEFPPLRTRNEKKIVTASTASTDWRPVCFVTSSAYYWTSLDR